MESIPYPHIRDLLARLLSGLQTTLGDRLVGLYLYGSLAWGDYDDGLSDVDLLAATAADINEHEFNALDRMQNDLLLQFPQWDNHLEIAYLSLHALKTFKTERSPIGIISPGEPFHIKDAGKDWLMNWYFVREYGLTLYGPPPQTIIEPTSKAEFIQSVKDHAAHWREWINDYDSRPSQAYAILLMCRTLYTCATGEQVSKKQAALWAAKELPEWSELIHNALMWRLSSRETNVNHEATLPETRRFVHVITDKILADK